MELRQLRYFVATAEELHFGRAADRLRISKPTLSQQIGVLERNLGTCLLDRRGRSVLLTDAGVVLLSEARQILAACDRARAAVAATAEAAPPLEVRVAQGVQHALAGLLERVAESGLPVNWRLTSGTDAEEAVLTGRADAAIIWLSTGEHTTLHETRIAATPVSIALPDNHPLAAADVVGVDQLADVPLVLFPRDLSPGVWDAFVTHLGRDHCDGEVIEERGGLDPMLHMLDLVAAGRGVAPFVDVVAEAIAPPGIRLRPMDPPLTLPVHVICREPTRADIRRLLTSLEQA